MFTINGTETKIQEGDIARVTRVNSNETEVVEFLRGDTFMLYDSSKQIVERQPELGLYWESVLELMAAACGLEVKLHEETKDTTTEVFLFISV